MNTSYSKSVYILWRTFQRICWLVFLWCFIVYRALSPMLFHLLRFNKPLFSSDGCRCLPRPLPCAQGDKHVYDLYRAWPAWHLWMRLPALAVGKQLSRGCQEQSRGQDAWVSSSATGEISPGGHEKADPPDVKGGKAQHCRGGSGIWQCGQVGKGTRAP